MLYLKKSFLCFSVLLLLLAGTSCRKGTFDINNVNPNVPSDVSPKFILSGALANSASWARGGNSDFAELYMGYWAVSGDYIPSTTTLTYNTTTSYFTGNWDNGYLILKNYRQMEVLAASDPNAVNYTAIAKIMESFHYERLVDMYNNIPYSDALNGGIEDFPKFDNAQDVYNGVLGQLDTAIKIINNAPASAEDPGSYDIMFGGDMTQWIAFANTLKLRTVMNLTQASGGPAIIQAELAGLSSGNFLAAGQDAAINPGYSNNSNAQQSPFYQDMGFNTSGAPQNNESYYRACSYDVNFMYNTNDTLRLYQFFAPNTNGVVQGRKFGSQAASGEDNQHISGLGSGLLQLPTSSAVILPACESFFLQAEAAQRGYLQGDYKGLYQTAVEESFRILQVANPSAAADNFITSSSDPNVNITASSNPLQTIIIQEWVALNGFDPIQSWNNWKRLGIPSDLPVSVFAGTTATHVPYRLLYPLSEYTYNSANVNAQGTISNLTSKIFWMP
jgi:SusD/RagB-like outer membrane lipoprotein